MGSSTSDSFYLVEISWPKRVGHQYDAFGKSRDIERIKLPAMFSGSTSAAASDERSNAEAQFSAAKTANSSEKRLTDEQVKRLTDSANAAKKKRGRPAS